MSIKKSFYVDGISCAGCVNAVEKTLLDVDGVKEAHVNVANGKASIESDSEISDDRISDAVKSAGYSVREEPAISKKKA